MFQHMISFSKLNFLPKCVLRFWKNRLWPRLCRGSNPSYDLRSCDLISYNIVSYDIMRITWYMSISYDVISFYHIMIYHLISCLNMTYHELTWNSASYQKISSLKRLKDVKRFNEMSEPVGKWSSCVPIQ